MTIRSRWLVPFVLVAGVLPWRPAVAASQRRLLLVFAPADSADGLRRQRMIDRRAAADFAERDLDVIEVVGNRVSGATEGAMVLRRRYRVAANDFRVLLVGKDGGVKLDEARPIAADRLGATIDAMPMRRDEMRR